MSVITDPPERVLILGREPAAWVGVIEAVLALAAAFALGVTGESLALIMAVVSTAAGVYTAVATDRPALGAITGLAKAVVALVGYYGLQLDEGQQVAVLALVPIVVGFWQRGQVSPQQESGRT